MKTFNILNICVIVSFFVRYQEEVSGQTFNPMYGGAPILYDNYSDDDLGLLVTVLLLAAGNRNGPNRNCCNCCNCGGSKSIPVPYPIPFPTNNPVINNQKSCFNYDNDNDENTDTNTFSKQSFKDQSSANYSVTYVPVPVGQNQTVDYSQQ